MQFAADIITDLKVLFAAMQAARVGANPVIIMNSIRLLGLSTVTTAAGGFMFRDEIAAGRLLGVPVIAAEHAPAADCGHHRRRRLFCWCQRHAALLRKRSGDSVHGQR